MIGKYNPFKPNHPVFSGLFAGRYKEIKRIDEVLYQTYYENPTNLLILGERGIGKTSLLLVAKCFAEGKIHFGKKEYNFLTIKFNLNNDMKLRDFILIIKRLLKNELQKLSKSKKVFDDCWDFIKKLEISGSKIQSETEIDDQLLIENFTLSLIETIKNLTCNKDNQKDGIVILIDESDTASMDLKIGVFLKSLTESLAAEKCNKILFILAGLPNTIDILRKSHESSLRLFEELNLKALILEDIKFVVEAAIKEINEKDSNLKVEATDSAIESFFNLSEGYPHFLQQLGYSTIAMSNNSTITDKIVESAMFSPGGALELIGNRYYADLFYDKINVDSYRQILTIMAEKWNQWISKEEIRLNFTGSGSNLNNGIKALKDRHIILTRRGVRGQYRLQWLSFAFWIKIHKRRN